MHRDYNAVIITHASRVSNTHGDSNLVATNRAANNAASAGQFTFSFVWWRTTSTMTTSKNRSRDFQANAVITSSSLSEFLGYLWNFPSSFLPLTLRSYVFAYVLMYSFSSSSSWKIENNFFSTVVHFFVSFFVFSSDWHLGKEEEEIM